MSNWEHHRELKTTFLLEEETKMKFEKFTQTIVRARIMVKRSYSKIEDSLIKAGKVGSLVKKKTVETLVKVRSRVKKLLECAYGHGTFQGLETYGRDPIKEARTLDPLIACTSQIEKVLMSLLDKKRGNPLLIGKPGIAKTALMDGVAQQIVRQNIHSDLADVRLIALDVNALIADTKYNGQFKKRLKAVLNEVKKAKRKVILFIDNIHLLLGAAQTEGSEDAANLFKLMLVQGQFQCIGATTLEEYIKYVEDPAIQTRTEPVFVGEFGAFDTVIILYGGIKERLENHHGVRIQYRALYLAAEWSWKYITVPCEFCSGLHLPDKAINLVNEACAFLRVRLSSKRMEINNLGRKIMLLDIKANAIGKQKDEDSKARLVQVRKELDVIIDELQHLTMNYREIIDRACCEVESVEQEHLAREIQEVKSTLRLIEAKDEDNTVESEHVVVGPVHVAKVLSERIGIPLNRHGQNDKEFVHRLLGRAVGPVTCSRAGD